MGQIIVKIKTPKQPSRFLIRFCIGLPFLVRSSAPSLRSLHLGTLFIKSQERSTTKIFVSIIYLTLHVEALSRSYISNKYFIGTNSMMPELFEEETCILNTITP